MPTALARRAVAVATVPWLFALACSGSGSVGGGSHVDANVEAGSSSDATTPPNDSAGGDEDGGADVWDAGGADGDAGGIGDGPTDAQDEAGDSSTDAGSDACKPRSTCPPSYTCGSVPDGCGNVIDCGSCGDGGVGSGTCVNSGTSSACCGPPGAVPGSGGACNGTQGAYCGNLHLTDCNVTCPFCDPGLVCEPALAPNTGDAGGRCCQVTNSCSDTYPNRCGQLDDGCGGFLSCTCVAGEVCVNSSPAGVCCTPQACTPGMCSANTDGCGGTISCGTCPYGPCAVGSPTYGQERDCVLRRHDDRPRMLFPDERL